MYTTQRYEAKVAVDHYIKEYVDVEGFLEACRACRNYNNVWSCPPYDFDVIEYWQKFNVLELTAVKIIFDEGYAGRQFEQEELEKITREAIGAVKAQLTQELYEREKEIPGSVSLSAGNCSLCNLCSRSAGEPCRHAEDMRYSIESLGGNVGLTTEKIMGLELEWMEEGRLPNYFVLVCGLLR